MTNLLTDVQVDLMLKAASECSDTHGKLAELAGHIKALVAERQAIEKLLNELWIVLDGYVKDADELAANLRFHKDRARHEP